jgi:hypothetical protein
VLTAFLAAGSDRAFTSPSAHAVHGVGEAGVSQMNPFSRLFCSRVLFRSLNQILDRPMTNLLTSIGLREYGLNAPLIWVIL